MADTITSSSELRLEAGFVDNDTRTIVVDNPKDSLTAAQINSVAETIRTTQAILGDKGGSNFLRFNTAKKTTTTRTALDLR